MCKFLREKERTRQKDMKSMHLRHLITLLCFSHPTAFTLRWDRSIETGGAQTAHGRRGASLHAPLHFGAQTLQSLLSSKGDQAHIVLHQDMGLVTYIYSTVQQGKSDLNSNTTVSMLLKGMLGLCGHWPMLPDIITHSLKPWTHTIEVDRSLSSTSAEVNYNLNSFLRWHVSWLICLWLFQAEFLFLWVVLAGKKIMGVRPVRMFISWNLLFQILFKKYINNWHCTEVGENSW